MSTKHDSRQIAGRYAQALFSLANQHKALDEVAQNIADLAEALAQSPQMQRLCTDPTLARADQLSAVQAVAKKMKFHSITAGTLDTLVQNRRLAIIAELAAAFANKILAHRGQTIAQVETVAALEKAAQKKLAASLTEHFGKQVELTISVNPQLIAGLRIYVDGVMIDASLAGRMQRLKDNLYAGIRRVS